MTETFWGLDIGGTKSALVVGNAGRVQYRKQVNTSDFTGDWQGLLETLLSFGHTANSKPLAVGVSCGGPLDSRRGLILSPPNLPGWDNVPITAWLEEKLGVPAFLQNDANACALAEWKQGAGRGCRNMVFLTFGTGMGAGLILNGALYTGMEDMAGEVGHIRMEPTGPVGYGKAGSFEGFCSGNGIRQLAASMLGRSLSARELVELADAGDTGAAEVLRRSAVYLGRGLSLLIDLLNPQCIVLGSIYARSTRWFREEALQMIQAEALEISRSHCRIVPAALGDSIGDIAALEVAHRGWEENA